MKTRIGILALQGDFEKHRQVIARIGSEPVFVRSKMELDSVAGLIVPGGESTTLTNLMKKHGLWDEIIAFGRQKPIFGTCAGLIVLAKKVVSNHVETLGLIDVTVARNAYGRQVDSFIDDLQLNLNGHPANLEGVFIRAPKIVAFGEGVTPLAWHKEDVVMAESGNIMVATFHPELTDDVRVHEYFLRKVIDLNKR